MIKILFFLSVVCLLSCNTKAAEEKIAQETAEQQTMLLRQYRNEYGRFLDSLRSRDVENASKYLKNIASWYLQRDKSLSLPMKKRIVEALLGTPFSRKVKPTEEFNKFYLDNRELLDAVFGFVQEYENFKKFYENIEELLKQKQPENALKLFVAEDEDKLNIYQRLNKLLRTYLTIKDNLKALDVVQQALDYPKPPTTKINREFFDNIYKRLNELRQQVDEQLTQELTEKGSVLKQYERHQRALRALMSKLFTKEKALRMRLVQAIQKLKSEEPTIYQALATPALEEVVTRTLKEEKEAHEAYLAAEEGRLMQRYKGPMKAPKVEKEQEKNK